MMHACTPTPQHPNQPPRSPFPKSKELLTSHWTDARHAGCATFGSTSNPTLGNMGRGGHGGGTAEDDEEDYRKMGFFGLFFMAFFW